ncbi:MAG TPA: FecR family protein [Candidatus Limnocylindrales bacterium]|nr:FecR family protein [Candidatus Limnocylindrales bacterium]
MHNHRGIFFILVPIGILLFPALEVFAQSQVLASVESVNGIVKVSLQGQGEVRARKGMDLQAGDILRTEVGGRLTLKLSDGSRLELGEDTRLDVTELSLTTRAKSSLFKLVWGRIQAVIAQPYKTPGSKFEVETPNALAGVKFTAFSMGYFRSTNTTWLSVENGTVTLTSLLSPGQPAEVLSPGQSAVVTASNPPRRTTPQELDQIREEGRRGESQFRQKKK